MPAMRIRPPTTIIGMRASELFAGGGGGVDDDDDEDDEL